MIDSLFSRVFGSYKTTVTGILSSLFVAAVNTISTGHWNNGTFIAAAAPLVVGALQKDAN